MDRAASRVAGAIVTPPQPTVDELKQGGLQGRRDAFTARLLKAQREADAALLKRCAGLPTRNETLDPYGDSDWPDSYAFRAAPYHGWPL